MQQTLKAFAIIVKAFLDFYPKFKKGPRVPGSKGLSENIDNGDHINELLRRKLLGITSHPPRRIFVINYNGYSESKPSGFLIPLYKLRGRSGMSRFLGDLSGNDGQWDRL